MASGLSIQAGQSRPGLKGMTVINSRLILSWAELGQLSGVSGQEDWRVYVVDYPDNLDVLIQQEDTR